MISFKVSLFFSKLKFSLSFHLKFEGYVKEIKIQIKSRPKSNPTWSVNKDILILLVYKSCNMSLICSHQEFSSVKAKSNLSLSLSSTLSLYII